MAFMAKATVAREEGDEWVIPDEDEYEAVVDRIEEFPTVKFGTTEPTIHARIVYGSPKRASSRTRPPTRFTTRP